MFRKTKLRNTKEHGQSLVEIMVVMTVGVLVLGAMVIVILNSLKSSQFAKNQIMATKVAQQTVDEVKVIRDNNWDIQFPTPSNTIPFNDLWNGSPRIQMNSLGGCSGPCYYKIDDSRTPFSLSLVSSVPTSTPVTLTGAYTGFSRQIILTDTDAFWTAEKNLIVKISWKDSSGSHESNLQTILTNYQAIPTPTP